MMCFRVYVASLFSRFPKSCKRLTLKANNIRQNTFGHFQSYFGRLQTNFGRIQKIMYLVIFNALKIYLKVNSFKFVKTVHSERHRRSPIPSDGLEIILVAKFAISDEKQRYLAHLSTLIQRNYKVNGDGIDQENGQENENDMGLFDDDQADEDDIIILESDEPDFS